MVTREALVDEVLGRKFSPFDRSIDMHVSKVRKKLGDTDTGDHIKTVRGTGYIYALSDPRRKTQPDEEPFSQDISVILAGRGAARGGGYSDHGGHAAHSPDFGD